MRYIDKCNEFNRKSIGRRLPSVYPDVVEFAPVLFKQDTNLPFPVICHESNVSHFRCRLLLELPVKEYLSLTSTSLMIDPLPLCKPPAVEKDLLLMSTFLTSWNLLCKNAFQLCALQRVKLFFQSMFSQRSAKAPADASLWLARLNSMSNRHCVMRARMFGALEILRAHGAGRIHPQLNPAVTQSIAISLPIKLIPGVFFSMRRIYLAMFSINNLQFCLCLCVVARKFTPLFLSRPEKTEYKIGPIASYFPNV